MQVVKKYPRYVQHMKYHKFQCFMIDDCTDLKNICFYIYIYIFSISE